MTTEINDAFAKLGGDVADGLYNFFARQYPETGFVVYPVLVKKEFVNRMGTAQAGKRSVNLLNPMTAERREEVEEFLVKRITTVLKKEIRPLVDRLMEAYDPYKNDYMLYFANNVEVLGFDNSQKMALQNINDSILRFIFPRENIKKIRAVEGKMTGGTLTKDQRAKLQEYQKTMDEFKIQLAEIGLGFTPQVQQQTIMTAAQLPTDAIVSFEAEKEPEQEIGSLGAIDFNE